MSTYTIVIQDGANDDGPEVHYFSTPDEASRSIESLLEAGCEPEGIRVFNATEMSMGITHRPVVALSDISAQPNNAFSEPRLSNALPTA